MPAVCGEPKAGEIGVQREAERVAAMEAWQADPQRAVERAEAKAAEAAREAAEGRSRRNAGLVDFIGFGIIGLIGFAIISSIGFPPAFAALAGFALVLFLMWVAG